MKKRWATYCFIAAGVLGFCTAQAQGDYDLTQRWFNQSAYNPAAVGNSFASSVFLHARAQWLGTDGAPTTQVATFDTYAEHLYSGFGLLLSRDGVGYLNTYTAKASYAYYITVGQGSVLSFGLSGGLYNHSRALGSDMSDEGYDPALATKRESHYASEFDFGMEYKGPFKLGAAIRHIGFYGSDEHAKPPISFWSYASMRYNLSHAVSIEPSLAYMYANRASWYEAGVLFYFLRPDDRWVYNDRFWIGAMFRLQGEVAVIAGLHVTPKMRIGYSFDYGVGHLSGVSRFATHEVFLSWQFGRIFYKDECCPSYHAPDLKYRKQKSDLVKQRQ